MRLSYLLVLLGCLLVTLPLEAVLGVRVYRSWRRLVLTLLPVSAIFLAWDVIAVAAGHWSFNPDRTMGIVLPGRLPVEEFLFFLVIPTCAILGFEAVRKARPWSGGDE